MSVLSESERTLRATEWVEPKTCAMCRQTKPRHAFALDSRRRDKAQPYCRDCVNAKARARYASDPEYRTRQAARRMPNKHSAEQGWRRGNPTCPRCGIEPRRVSAAGVVAVHCAKCESEVGKTWRAALPKDKRSEMDRVEALRRWGMTPDDYDALLLRQGGGCAICGGLNSNGRRLAIDHDHDCCPGKGSCGKCVRGLLCAGCNYGLGHFREDSSRLARAIAYLST